MSNIFSTLTTTLFTAGILHPKGLIAFEERNIIIIIVLLILVAIIPAYILLFIFARKYRVGNSRITTPEDNKTTHWVALFWLLPTFIVILISFTTWRTTHALDPYKPLVSGNAPLTIQVVALQWKWLFIYPKQHIATVNLIEIPVNTPIHFELTADAPMNSFWIPQLAGQIYSMPGMSTQLNLMATQLGDFPGLAMEINGQGFSGMKFTVQSRSESDFEQWVSNVEQGTSPLTFHVYTSLSKPSENNPVTYYSSVDENMYNEIMAKFMMPTSSFSESSSTGATTTMQDMNMNMDMDMMNMNN